jgi:ectoine hydroxylase-related dioxygenase (phytanoyl-CoA dioxygenase family)
MEEYNNWCYEFLNNPDNKQTNYFHPKQKNKLIINNIIEIMSKNNPKLLLSLINNKYLNQILDKLLGFSCFGSLTCHCIKPQGERQHTHVDYPIHVGSGKFWDNNPSNIDKYITEHQLNNILPYFSLQCLIASDTMSKFNGSTEVIPGSHLIHNVDKKVLDKEFCNSIENNFINANLEQGDVLLFNRRLIHRGGHNMSNLNRNSLIIQYVWLFGLQQHKHNYQQIYENLISSNAFQSLTDENKKNLLLRIKQPYPIDTTIHN